MNFSYRLRQDGHAFTAECVENDAVGEGSTRQAAIESLRTALEERMFRPDAVAPPSVPDIARIELREVTEEAPAEHVDLGGPGDAPLR